MKISKRAYYGLQAVVRLAKEDTSLSVAVLAKKEHLPEHFLEKIFQKLRRAGIVEATRGTDGGYRLAFDPSLITAGHILMTLDGALIPFPCTDGSQSSCPLEGKCKTQNVWQKLSTAIGDTLDGITVKELIQ